MNAPLTLGAALMLAVSAAWAQHDDSGTPINSEEESKAVCLEMAKEDRIPQGDLEAYMKDCMTSFEDVVPEGDMETTPADR